MSKELVARAWAFSGATTEHFPSPDLFGGTHAFFVVEAEESLEEFC